MSTTTKPVQQDMLDILFESRNKAYGAYLLRRNYPDYVRNALLVTIAAVLLLLALPLISRLFASMTKAQEQDFVEVKLEAPPPLNPDVPPPPPPPPVETPPPPKVETVKFVPPIVKKDEEVKEEEKIVIVDSLKDVKIDIKNEEGAKSGDYNDLDTAGTGKAKVVIKEPEKKEPEIFEYVEQMPTFPGGDLELRKYLAKNIRYPDMARESGIEGTVVVSFIVDENGAISNLSLDRDIGGNCGKEAMRVVKEMPNWSAGKQNGKAVKVKFKLPVKFRLN